MNILWNIKEDEKNIRVRLYYNIFTGIKNIFVNDEKVLACFDPVGRKKLSFSLSEKEYTVKLIPEGYGYKGELFIGEQRITAVEENKTFINTPLWVIPFALINMSIPILSVEAFTTWLIGFVATYATAKLAEQKHIDIRTRIAISFAISAGAWFLYYGFYSSVKSKAPSNFLPFM